MLGFIIGTFCLIGLVRVVRRGRYWGGHHGYGHGYGHHGGFGAGVGGPRRWLLRGLFERLETTPGQEKAIMAALDELRSNRKLGREELAQSRGDLAQVVAGGLVDDGALEETFARHDRLLAQVRVSFIEALRKVTEALDEKQRKDLARMIEGGFTGLRGGFRGPYRDGYGTWA